MEFKTNKPIYQQIVDFCFSKILTREWRAEERVVSVRELSTQLAVNSRTVMKAYEYLQAEDIIYPERGMGFYLAKDAVKKVMKIQKKEFFDNQLADVFLNMELLGISIDEVIERYNKLKNSRYAKTALWITFGLLFVLIIVKVFTLMYELNSAVQS